MVQTGLEGDGLPVDAVLCSRREGSVFLVYCGESHGIFSRVRIIAPPEHIEVSQERVGNLESFVQIPEHELC